MDSDIKIDSETEMYDICLLARVLSRIKVQKIVLPKGSLKDIEFRDWLSCFMDEINKDISHMESRMKELGYDSWFESEASENETEEMIEFKSIANRLFLHLQWMRKNCKEDKDITNFLRKSSEEGGFNGLIMMIKNNVITII